MKNSDRNFFDYNKGYKKLYYNKLGFKRTIKGKCFTYFSADFGNN